MLHRKFQLQKNRMAFSAFSEGVFTVWEKLPRSPTPSRKRPREGWGTGRNVMISVPASAAEAAVLARNCRPLAIPGQTEVPYPTANQWIMFIVSWVTVSKVVTAFESASKARWAMMSWENSDEILTFEPSREVS